MGDQGYLNGTGTTPNGGSFKRPGSLAPGAPDIGSLTGETPAVSAARAQNAPSRPLRRTALAIRSEPRWHDLGCPELEVWAVAPLHQGLSLYRRVGNTARLEEDTKL